jgi:hypothetical protein
VNEAEFMTPEQRLHRIAEILSRGIARWQLVRLGLLSEPTEGTGGAEMLPGKRRGEDLEEEMLKYIQLGGASSPRAMSGYFMIPQSTAYRKIRKLAAAGRLAVSEKTSSIKRIPGEKRSRDAATSVGSCTHCTIAGLSQECTTESRLV